MNKTVEGIIKWREKYKEALKGNYNKFGVYFNVEGELLVARKIVLVDYGMVYYGRPTRKRLKSILERQTKSDVYFLKGFEILKELGGKKWRF